jgi:hypothetical protein
MYVSVGKGAEPRSDFVVEELMGKRDNGGRPVVIATVRNTGERALDLSGTLQLSEGPGGLSAGPFDATLGTTLGIGKAQPVEVVLDPRLPAGPWRAVLTLRSGRSERTVEGALGFPMGTGSTVVRPRPSTADKDAGLVLPAVAAALLALLALFLLFLVWRRRDRREDEAPGRA